MTEVVLDQIDFNVIDISQLKIKTNYCVSQEVHDAQVRATIARKLPAIEIPTDITYDPIAVVCSGPSLKDSWEEIKRFSTIITVSGAHDFLIERGIIPTFHMEADPRKHKSFFVKNPRKDVQYLIASCCHSAIFEYLKDYNVKVWHILGREDSKDIPNIYPRGHWILTGGSNVGLRALVMARLLGHLQVHIFGMDCSADDHAFHANEHPNEPKEKNYRTVTVGDRQFRTTEVFLEYARQFFKEKSQLPDTQFILHGDGLLQNIAVQKLHDPAQINKMVEENERVSRKQPTIAVYTPNTISDSYAELNQKLHQERPDYGAGGHKHVNVINSLISNIKPVSILDYGCGKGLLGRSLPFPIWEYDPAIPGKSDPPRPAELVVCTDVLEHIEPDFLDNVLLDIKRCVLKIGYLVIHTGPSGKTLADGRNTHLIQQPLEWWKEKLEQYFFIPGNGITSRPPMIHFVVSPKIH